MHKLAQQPERFLPLGAGPYLFGLRVGDQLPYWTSKVTLAEGEVQTITLVPDDPRATLRLVQASRAFGDAVNEPGSRPATTSRSSSPSS